MIVKIKKLHKDAVVPQYQTVGSAGFDLHALEGATIAPKSRVVIATGLAFAIEQGYEVQVRPRSGLAFKHGITVLNTPGTIDSDYRGEIKVVLINLGEESFTINQGDRIAQGVVKAVIQAQMEEVAELDATIRGERGFGSTGR